MSRFFKGLALLVAVACFTWVAVLWRWQVTQREMSVNDIGVYLVALPLTLFALLLLGRWAWRGAQAQQGRQAAAAAAAAASAAAPAAAAPPAEDAERRRSVQVLTAHVRCLAGRQPAEVLRALAEGKPRPELDPELRDDAGLPLMTARLPDLDADLQALELEAVEARVRQRLGDSTQAVCRPELGRALAAVAPLVDDALAALRPWQDRFSAPAAPARPGAVPSPEHDPALPLPPPPAMLRVLPVWPQPLGAFETAVANDWLLARVLAAGLVTPSRVSLLPVPAPDQAWLDAERTLALLQREQRLDVLLVVAAHSALGEASVARLQAARALYTAATPKAPIAGEGAAVLALAPAAWPADPDADAPPPRLHRAALVKRDKPIDAVGRTAAQAAQACIAQALPSGPFAPEAMAFALHDADQHGPRAAEALAALLHAQPHLQAGEDTLGSGALTGQLGAVAPWLLAALAAEQARELGKPCLALSVDDPQLRLSFVVRPAHFDPAASPPAAAA